MRTPLIIGFLALVLFLLLVKIFTVRHYKNSAFYTFTKMPLRKLKKNKGAMGEYHIVKAIEKSKLKGKLLVNLYLPISGGRKTECDIVFIHQNGVLVIESKNYSGRIVGDDLDQYWAQEFEGGSEFSFFNPVRQNKGHIRAIVSNIIIDKPNLYESLIVFGQQANLSWAKTEEPNTSLLTLNTLPRFLKKFKRQAPKCNKYEVDEIYERLLPYAHANYFTKKDHRKDISFHHD